ncbi:MAG: hypothetical protein ACYC0V_07260, partial [Armatimonadota bacterium]
QLEYKKVVFYSKKNLNKIDTVKGNIADVMNSRKWSEFTLVDYIKDEYGDLDTCRLNAVDIESKQTWDIASNRRQIQHKWIAPSLIAYVTKDKYEHISIHQYDLSTSKDTLLAGSLDVPKVQLDRYDELTKRLFYTISYRWSNYDPHSQEQWFVSVGSKPQRQVFTTYPNVSPVVPGFPGVKGAAK